MSRSKLGVMICATVMLASTTTYAASSEGADTLTSFEGEWHCNVKEAGGIADPKGFSTASTARMTDDWFVSWVVAFHDGTSSKMVAKMTYDTFERRYVVILFGHDGSYGWGTSPGWDGDTLTFTGEKHTKEEPTYFKKSFTKKGDDAFVMSFVTSEDGKTYSASLVICRSTREAVLRVESVAKAGPKNG